MIKFGTGGWRAIIGRFYKGKCDMFGPRFIRFDYRGKVDKFGIVIGFDRRFCQIKQLAG